MKIPKPNAGIHFKLPPHAESFINWGYDAISRVTSETNELGQFDYTYVDNTSGSSKGLDRLASIAYPSANNQDTNFTWYPNLGDHRLQRIENLTGAGGELSRFTYGYNAAGEITQWYQRQNSTNTHRTAGYDLASQLTSAPTDSGANTAVTVTGTQTNGDVLTITVLDYGLTGGQKVKNYTVVSGDTTPTIAAASITTAINADTDLSGIGVTATSSSGVITLASSSARATQFDIGVSASSTYLLALGNPTAKTPLGTDLTYTYDTGSNRTTEVVGGTTTTFNYNDVNALTSITGGATLTWDKNGNMTSDGTNTYAWDAENRLLKITYTGSNNFTDFVYDPLGRCVKIVETTNNSVTSTKQFVWCGTERCEERDNSNALARQFFTRGQINFSGGSGTNYFYTLDHLGSTREVTNSSAAIQAQYLYSPYGVKTNVVSETIPADFQYAGMYKHERSALNLTWFRAYKPDLGRWISRDPLGEAEGPNLFAYVDNDPLSWLDPLGLEIIGQDAKGAYTTTSGTTEGALPDPLVDGMIAGAAGAVGGLLGGAGKALGGALGKFLKPKPCPKSGVGKSGKGGDDSSRYRKSWEKAHPTQRAPYSTDRRYHPNGDIKSVQTYDKYGRRDTRYDLKDSMGRPPHRHNFEQGPGKGAGQPSDKLPLDQVPPNP